MIPIGGALHLTWLYGMQGTASCGQLHTYGTNIYNVRTLNNHALCTRVVRVDGVDTGARAGAEGVCIWEACTISPADVGETKYG